MQERIAHTLSTALTVALLLAAPSSALAATLVFNADDFIVANGGPVEVTAIFGTPTPAGVVGTAAKSVGLDFSLGNVEGIFRDGDGVHAVGGTDSSGIIDLFASVDAAIVVPGTLDPARTSYIRAEAGFSMAGTVLLEALDADGNVIAAAFNNIPLGPHGRTTATIDHQGVFDIAGFRVSGATDNWGLPSVEIEAPIPAAPAAACPNDGNPFGVDGVILFTGSTGDDEEGCSDIVKRLGAGTHTRGVFVTRGNQPSPAPQVPCEMPLDEETSQRIVAQGDEICGVDAVIEVDRGGATIDAFVPSDPSITSVMPQTAFPTPSIRVVTVPPVQSPLAAPWYHKLGDITITVPNDATRVVAKSGVGAAGILSAGDTTVPMDVNLYEQEGVGAMPASLEAEGLINTVLFIPEPSLWLQWPTALLGLALLARLRRRRD